jgi:hypothetical protein
MPTRTDISDKLIHFTKGNSASDAFEILRKIINERRLVAGNYMIRGGYGCVCFTEAPITAISAGFLSSVPLSRYAPFGLMFDKSWIFALGGRPVIYQSESEFNILPDEVRWRHVRYEPIGEQPVDFTWEREWRIRRKELVFKPADAEIVMPNRQWTEYLLHLHRYEQDMRVQAYSTIFDEDEAELAEQLRQDFSWRVVNLG